MGKLRRFSDADIAVGLKTATCCDFNLVNNRNCPEKTVFTKPFKKGMANLD
ncbi:MAG: hypothetical protein KA101_01500 [Saprospiraceae bacterium]|nr:hypothetical protein [Saprospiraceae bacterium]